MNSRWRHDALAPDKKGAGFHIVRVLEDSFGKANSSPKLGGVPERSEGGVVPVPKAGRMRLRNGPACSLVLAGSPPNLGGEFLAPWAWFLTVGAAARTA